MEGGVEISNVPGEQGLECTLVEEYLPGILRILSSNFSTIDKNGYLFMHIFLFSPVPVLSGDWTQGLGSKQVFFHKLYLAPLLHDFSGLVWYADFLKSDSINLKAWMLFCYS